MVTRRFLIGIVLGWALACLLASAQRIALWADEPQLWADAVAQAPQKPRPWVNLGRQQILVGDLDTAIRSLQRADALASDRRRDRSERVTASAFAEVNLAIALLHQQDRAGSCRWATLVDIRFPAWPIAQRLVSTACAPGASS